MTSVEVGSLSAGYGGEAVLADLGVSDPLLVKHMRTTMVDFIMRTLKPAGAAQPKEEKKEAEERAKREKEEKRLKEKEEKEKKKAEKNGRLQIKENLQSIG